MVTLPPLPYAFGALAPAISAEGVKRHYEDNHAKYARTLNELTASGQYKDASLADILATSTLNSPVYNNAAQFWAHNMWWQGMRPKAEGGGRKPTGAGAEVIEQFGGYEAFKKKWVEAGTALFGSGWVWLSLDKQGKAYIDALPNAILPQRDSGRYPILVSDLWEHAYYCQYGTNRKAYLERFFDVVCWNSVNARIRYWSQT
jgi:Fe-Mn family superoxide dismutase